MSNLGTKQQFASENFSVDCTFKPGCIVDMQVRVSPQASQASFHRALKLVKKEVSLPGFRKGHVPDETVIQHFGAEVDKEAQRVMARTAFAEASQLIGRQPFYDYRGEPSLHLKRISFSKDKGSELSFEYEVEPVIPTIEFDKLHLELVEPKVTSMDEALVLYSQLRYINCEKKEVNRPAQEGDAVNVQLITDEKQEGADSREFILKTGLAPVWLIPVAIGMSAGETKDLPQPTEGQEDVGAPKRIKVVSVLECILPEENEEFAQKFGGRTTEDLKAKLLRRLEFEAKNAAHDRMRRKLRNELIRLYAFDLPQSLVESETESRFLPFWDIFSKKTSSSPNDKDMMRKEFLEESKRFLTCSMLLKSLFSAVKPTCSQYEVFEELNHQSSQVPVAQRTIYPGLDEKTLINRLALNVMLRKCEDYCIEQRLGVRAPTLETSQEESKVVVQ